MAEKMERFYVMINVTEVELIISLNHNPVFECDIVLGSH